MKLTDNQILQQAIDTHKEGKYDVAEKLYREILKVYPMSPEVNNNLGALLYSLGRLVEAEMMLKKTIELKPGYADAYNNLANVQKGLDRLDEAEKNYKKAIELNPKFAYAFYNLGLIKEKLNKLDEAKKNYKKAIELNPKFAYAFNNLASIQLKQDKLEEAEKNYTKAIEIKPDYAEAYSNLGGVLFRFEKLDEAQANFKKAIELNPNYALTFFNLSVVQDYLNNFSEEMSQLEQVLKLGDVDLGLKASVKLAILKFLDNDLSLSKKYLQASSKIVEKLTSDFGIYIAYYKHLLKLLRWHKNRKFYSHNSTSTKKLYVIGDSHTLDSHGLNVQNLRGDFLCKSLLIIGCKQSDLGSSVKNRFKNKLESIFYTIPKTSEILLSIGEIDCRLESGIIKHNEKYPEKNRMDLIKTTITNYLNYILKINFYYKHNITIQGVPCPNIDSKITSKEKILELTALIRDFNIILKKKSTEIGFDFLDIYKVSNRGDGFSNKIWHLDNYHLTPEGMIEAWNTHRAIDYKSIS